MFIIMQYPGPKFPGWDFGSGIPEKLFKLAITNNESFNKQKSMSVKMDLESTDQCYIASLDILGFSAFVKNNEHHRLIDLIESFVNKIKADRDLINAEYLKIVDDEITEEVKSLIISDTIILYSSKAEIESFLKIVLLIQILLTNSFLSGIPLRGCLTAGEISVKHLKNNDIIFGLPLVEAYEEEKKQEWAGCIITNKCLDTVKRFHVNNNKPCIKWLKRNKDIIEYHTPLKNNIYALMHVVNWTKIATAIKLNDSIIQRSFYEHNKEPLTHEDIIKTKLKVKNTLDFWKNNIS